MATRSAYVHLYQKIPKEYSMKQRKQLVLKMLPFTIINGKLYKQRQDQILCQCLHDDEILVILQEMHEGVGDKHFLMDITAQKVLNAKYWWPTLHKVA